MSKINAGTQPAFGGRFYPGMSLRDYLAAQALVAMGQHVPSHFPNGSPVGVSSIAHPRATEARAQWAYQQADAMVGSRSSQFGKLEAADAAPWKFIPADDTPGHREPPMVQAGKYLWKACAQVTRQDEVESQARLIAAAPDMLKALKEIAIVFTLYDWREKEDAAEAAAVEGALAVIAKAEGRTDG